MSKSSSSQYLYREVVVDPVILATVYLGDAKFHIHEVELKEEFKELQDALVVRVMDVIQTQLTERQREVMIKTYIEGRTQMEVADLLGVCQTTVHKIISGNIDYSNGGRRYGGALKKIRRLCETDQEIKDILGRMEEIKGLLSEI
jgi:predicted DNA-binding protein YlxM (UPF0122 family)